jgi:hypothetical protein
MNLQNNVLDPEYYTSLAYLMIKYLSTGIKSELKMLNGRRIRMLRVNEKLKDSIEDELLYPKVYIEEIN